jgi:ribosomal protein L11 methyltransferase
MFLQKQTANTTAPLQLYCRQLRDTAYLTQWQQFFKPLWIGAGLCIRPPWDTASLSSDIACLTLEPGLAFGTGSHPTTHLCLKMLTQWIPRTQSKTLLDVGCGSGILSLAGLKLGVLTAIGVDIDPQAVTVAQHNATLNDLHHRVRFLQGSWDLTRQQFDLITANIYLEPLVNMTPPLAQRLRHHGILILSGLLASQEARLRAALSQAQLVVHQRLSEAEWVALAVRHRDSRVV